MNKATIQIECSPDNSIQIELSWPIYYDNSGSDKISGKTLFEFYLNNAPFVVLTDYEDIKEILKKDEIAGRSMSEPGNRFRPGWQSMENVEPGVNKGRNPGVIGTQVHSTLLL